MVDGWHAQVEGGRWDKQIYTQIISVVQVQVASPLLLSLTTRRKVKK